MSKNLIGIVLALGLVAAGCAHKGTATTAATSTSATVTTPPPGPAPAATDTGSNKEVTLPSGLKYVDTKIGDGAIAEDGMMATVHYTGWLTDGTKFDSSVDRGQPFSFRIGAGQVIRGWDEGVKGMRTGGKRKLTIPSDLGYGAAGTPGGPIPPNATLVFDVELIAVH